MSGIFKVLNSFLGVLAIITCLAAVCIIAYSIIRPDLSGLGLGRVTAAVEEGNEETGAEVSPSVSVELSNDGSEAEPVFAEHIHHYKEDIYPRATCLSNGRATFMCNCGDLYYEEIEALGHLLGEWVTLTAPTATLDGVRIRVCSRCNETIAREMLPSTGGADASNSSPAPSVSPTPRPSPHVHNYIASISREPTCSVAGIRKFTCSCESFYLENINAIGHLSGPWSTIKEPTADSTGIRQRICNVCKVLIDTQTIARLTASPSPSAGATPASSPSGTPAASPSGSARPSTGPHTHTFAYYTRLVPTCTDKGISTGTCSCGDEDSKLIDIDKDNHNFNFNGVCTRCGFSRNASPSSSP
ncbi:MAG: hypothetical protein FWC09_04695 [Lachnospiraceae bacterium]|nr:hypothetical protein [Lachnospiraceae bacterium]